MKNPKNYIEALADYTASEFNRGTQYVIDQPISMVYTDSAIFLGVNSQENLSSVLYPDPGRIVSSSTQFNNPAPGSNEVIENVIMWDIKAKCFVMFSLKYDSSAPYFTSTSGIGYAQSTISVTVSRVWGEDDRAQITAVRRYMRKVFKCRLEDEIFSMILVHLRALRYQDDVYTYAFFTYPDTSLRVNVAPLLVGPSVPIAFDPYLEELPILVGSDDDDVVLGVPLP